MASAHNQVVSKFAHDFHNCIPHHENIKHIGSAIGAHTLQVLQLHLSWRRIQSCSHKALFDEARMGEDSIVYHSRYVHIELWHAHT